MSMRHIPNDPLRRALAAEGADADLIAQKLMADGGRGVTTAEVWALWRACGKLAAGGAQEVNRAAS